MSTKIYAKSGRRWKELRGGLDELSQVYQVVTDEPIGVRDESKWSSLFGLPEIGSAHPKDAGLYVDHYDIEEGTEAGKSSYNVTVVYRRDALSIEQKEKEDPEAPEEEYACEEWGWESGEDSRELTVDATGKCVLNSAGDPFESVPVVTVPAPVFRKVMKFKTRQADYAVCDGKVNRGVVTIGGREFDSRSLLCSVSEKRIFDSDNYNYQYTVTLRYRSNKYTSRNAEGQEVTNDAHWDCPVVDSGMRVKGSELLGYKRVIPTMVDAETGVPTKIASSVLLDGRGQMLEVEGEERPIPHVIVFFAYEETDFPSWFYSEPVIREDGSAT